ncbi:MAG: cobalamin-dependent protein [Gammaproteobacteria bacterium]|nr:cobalamin-dependent protein [Gammaproteobacteria bacterium]
MKNKFRHVDQAFKNLKRYEQEIVIDTYDTLLESNKALIKETILLLGSNEIHHLIKYHYKIILNSFFFNDIKLLKTYHEWLYRVYYYKQVDLDFFYYLNEQINYIANQYINKTIAIRIDEYFQTILQYHHTLKSSPFYKRVLQSHHDEAVKYAKLLMAAETDKAYQLAQSKSPQLEEFIYFYNEIISNAMKYIGYGWEIGQISVAKEHIASQTLQDIIPKLLENYPEQPANQQHLLFCSAPNELHGLGSNVAAKTFKKLGYRVTNLGKKLPAKEIFDTVIELQPDILFLSATLPGSMLDVAYIIDETNHHKDKISKDMKIGIAGSAFENISLPATTLHADFYMDKLKIDFIA